MHQISIACGVNPIGGLIVLGFWAIGSILAIWVAVVVKARSFPQSHWVNQRAPLLKSFRLLLTGATVVMIVMGGLYTIVPALFTNRLGFLHPYQLILLFAIYIHDALMLTYWLKQAYAQTLSLDPNQQIQVDPAHTNWSQPWVMALRINCWIFLGLLLGFVFTN